MATTPLTDQERALLAQFVASNTSDPANAPILIQYVLDRLARGGSTLAEVVSQLSPNGLDANADFGPYLDIVDRTLAPEVAAAPEMGGSSTSSEGYEQSAPTRAIIPGPNPIPGMREAYKGLFAGQPPTEPIVEPSRVRVASLDPLPGPIPPVDIPPVQQAEPRAAFPPPTPPVPRRDPRPAPIPEAAVPTRPVAAPSTPAVTSVPLGPFRDNVPGPTGYSNPSKDQASLSPSAGLEPAAPIPFVELPAYVPNANRVAADTRLLRDANQAADPVIPASAWETIASIPSVAPQGPSTRSVPSVAVPPRDLISDSFSRIAAANPTAPPDLIEQTLARIGAANGPFQPANAGDDLALGPVNGVNLPAVTATTAPNGHILAEPQFANVQARLPALAPPAGPTRLDAAAGEAPKQRIAPTPATMSPELRQMVTSAPGVLQLNDTDRELLVRAVATEVDPRIARSNPEAYALQVQRVTDTILNRVASPQFPNTVAAVLNQDRQFSAIAGPTGRPGERFGAVENIPAARADDTLRGIFDAYLDDRVAGELPSSVGGALNYANPGASDASNLDWINALDMAVDDAGPFSHRYGVADGGRPFEATFVNPALSAANALAGGYLAPQTRLSKPKDEDKRIQVKAAPISDAWLGQVPDRIERAAPIAPVAQKQQPAAREPITQSWTTPQSSSDRVRMAQAAARAPGRAPANPGKISAPSGGSTPMFSSNGGSTSMFSSNGGSVTTPSSKNSPTTPSKISSPTSSVASSKTSSTPSKTSNTSKSSSDKSSSKNNGYSYNPSGR